jgi:aminopeptidase
MDKGLEAILENYADLILKIGLNFQHGQRLLFGSISESSRVPFDAAPLVRKVAQKAYQLGASLVEVFWGDDHLSKIRYLHSEKDNLVEYPSWIVNEIKSAVKRGDAQLIIWGENPNLLDGVDPERLAIVQDTIARELTEVFDYAEQNPSNWCGVCYPNVEWAISVFPDFPAEVAVQKLWDYIIQFCHLDTSDPIGFWLEHNDSLDARAQFLNETDLKSLHLKSTDTDLSIDLPNHHIWVGPTGTLPNGLQYCANIPTEEIFTLPDREGVNGYLKATKPFNHEGSFIDGMRLEFRQGKVVNASAEIGQEALIKILEIDEGAAHLGELALVPQSTPIAQSNILFNHGLLDENASVHLAFGRAYRDCLVDGEDMNKEEFKEAGGNFSVIHLDFMIGSEDMDVDGLKHDGSSIPLMRAGEWAFSVS